MLKIGLAQTDIPWGEVDRNLKKAERFFSDAAKEKVDLLVFPEVSMTGFTMDVKSVVDSWERQLHFFEQKTGEYHMTAIFGCAVPLSAEEKRQHPEWNPNWNRLFVVEDGVVRMHYDKIHPFTHGQEGNYFQPGEEIVSMKWKDTYLGAFTCYDLRFSEIFQISSGVSEILVLNSNWPASRVDQWDCLLQARAIENQCYFVGVNRVGMGGGVRHNGHSAIYDPVGKRITTLTEEEALIVGEIDLEQVAICRNRFTIRADRREDIYYHQKVKVIE